MDLLEPSKHRCNSQSPTALIGTSGSCCLQVVLRYTLDDRNQVLCIERPPIPTQRSVSDAAREPRANLDACDQYDQTPLHRAAIYNNAAIAELLIAKGADYRVRTVCSAQTLTYICW